MILEYKVFSDADLVLRLKNGEPLAYNEIYNRYAAVLYIHAYKRMQDREECRDIVQEIFLKLWSQRDTLDIKTTLPGYLYTSIRNKVFNLLDRKRLDKEYLSSIADFATQGVLSTDHLVRQRQLKEIIDFEIDQLPPRTKEIFLLSREGFLSHKEIAELLKISDQTVKTTVNNALKVLRSKLSSVLFLVV